MIEVTKEFHEISISDTETESELNTTNEEVPVEEEGRVKGEKEKVAVAVVEEEVEEGEETDAAPTRQMAMPKVSCNSKLFRSESLILFHRWT